MLALRTLTAMDQLEGIDHTSFEAQQQKTEFTAE